MEENKLSGLMNHGLKYGLILGFTQVAITLLLYIVDKTLMVSFITNIIIMVIYITLMVLPARSYKKQQGGIISFRDAFFVCLLTIAGGTLIMVVFNYFLYNFIDPGLADFIKNQAIEKTVSLMEKFGSSAEDIDKAIKPLTQEDFTMTPSKLLGQYFQTVLIGAIPALIIAAIIRSKPNIREEA
jgi:hypothetical protein